MTRKKGFTLVELMITVAILSILAIIGIPKFADLLRRSKEGYTKGSLGSIRSGISMYSADELSQYSSDLVSLTTKYIDIVPGIKLGNYHPDTDSERSIYVDSITISDINDSSGWVYSSKSGEITIDCTHTDREGRQFYEW